MVIKWRWGLWKHIYRQSMVDNKETYDIGINFPLTESHIYIGWLSQPQGDRRNYQ